MEGRRSIIPVGPANYRDSVVLKPESLNSILLINKLTRQIINQIKTSSMKIGHSPERSIRKGNYLILEKKKSCYVRDFTKAGLTFPHKVLKAMHECLEERYQGLGFQYMDVLYNLDIFHTSENKRDPSEKKIQFKRGHCLGMANEITTLCQCVIDEMNRHDLDFPELETNCYNDDFRTIGNEITLKKYEYFDKRRLEKLGFEIKVEKTGILLGASIFLEEYVVRDEEDKWDKNILNLLSLDNLFFAYNIVHAKSIARTIFYDFYANYNEECLQKFRTLIDFWGYEFYPEESKFTDEMGGWVSLYYLGRKQMMRKDYNLDALALKNHKAANAEQVEVSIDKFLKASPHYYGIKSLEERKIPKHIRSLCPHIDLITWNTKNIAETIWRSVSLKLNPSTYWKKLADARMKKYKERVERPLNIAELFSLIAQRNASTLYLIPKFLIKKQEFGGYRDRER
jgi:hypothetical protein